MKLKINHNSSLSYHVYRKSNTFIKLKLKFNLKIKVNVKVKFNLINQFFSLQPCLQLIKYNHMIKVKVEVLSPTVSIVNKIHS